MAKYVLLYIGGGMPETEAETAQVMKAWEAWYTSLGSAVVDPGNPFTPAAKSIAASGAVSSGSNGINGTGYTILQAASLEEAAQMAKTCPVLQGGAGITIFETFEIMA
jgi:hypothetical protein